MPNLIRAICVEIIRTNIGISNSTPDGTYRPVNGNRRCRPEATREPADETQPHLTADQLPPNGGF